MPAKTLSLQLSALGLFCLLAPPAWATMRAQEPAPAPKLLISIQEGEGALNDIHQRTAREPVVEVQDENHKPIAGAVVLFTVPSLGPSGSFADGALTLSTVTDAQGRAVGTGLQPNNVQGSFDIHVTASYRGAKVETTIHQRNVVSEATATSTSAATAAAHGLSAKTWLIILGSAAAAGTVAAIVATSGGSSTTITAGNPTVGPPTAGAGIQIPLHRHGH